MSRWISFLVCAVAGVLLAVGGLLVPAHLRAVDGSVLEAANRRPVPMKVSPDVSDPLPGHTEPLTEFAVRTENRQKLLAQLEKSPRREVQALLRFRAATNTVLLPPSGSASGQALDTALVIAGLLIEHEQLSPQLRNELHSLAVAAEGGADSREFEQALLDLMSLGQRFASSQLVVFVRDVRDVETLGRLTGLARSAGAELPVLAGAIQFSGQPAAVVDYLAHFSQTGMQDLGASLRYGSGGVNELLRRKQRLHLSHPGPVLGAEYCLLWPRGALIVKWLLYLGGGFFLAAALHFARRVPRPERPLHVRGFHVAREFLFALGFLAVVLLLSEPFLAQESQKVQLPIRLRLPTLGDAVRPGTVAASPSTFMNQSLLTLLMFFVIQALIYIACLVKLAEIRRQPIGPRIKLKLLENEDHLFDAGIYLGFVGTIVSLILVSIGVVKFGLMAAYSSTSFGIVFVATFKIFNLRPLRRKLLLEAESMPAVPDAPVPPAPRPQPISS